LSKLLIYLSKNTELVNKYPAVSTTSSGIIALSCDNAIFRLRQIFD